MIALYKGISPFSRAIRFLSWSDYSHASWIDMSTGHEFEATAGAGVREVDAYGTMHNPGTSYDLFSINLQPEEHAALLGWFRSQIGKSYDYRGIGGFISRRDAAQNQEKWFCSEFIFAGFLAIRRPLLRRIEAYQVTPAMLSYSPWLQYEGEFVIGKQQVTT